MCAKMDLYLYSFDENKEVSVNRYEIVRERPKQ